MTATEAVLAAVLVALAGAGHCLGMCGGISVGLGFAVPADQRRGSRLVFWHLLFASGRLLTYSALGLLAGGFGQVLRAAMPGGGRVLMVLAAVLLLLTAVALLGRDLGLQRLERLGMALWERVQPRLQPLLPLRAAWQAVVVGMAWGLLPCGLVYTALTLAASTGSALTGAVLMLAFGLVTVVPVTGTGLVAGSLPWMRNPWWRRAGGGVGLAFAGWLLLQALGGHGGHQHGTQAPQKTADPHAHHHHPSHP